MLSLSNLFLQMRLLVNEVRDQSYDRALRRWLSRIALPEVDLESRIFAFNTVRASRNNLHVFSDLFLGYLIAKNGGTAYVLLDDGVLQLWDTVQLNRFKGRLFNVMHAPVQRRLIKRSIDRLGRVFATPNLHVMWYSDFLPSEINEDLDEDEESYAVASSIRYFETGELDLNDPEQHQYHRLSLENARISKAVGRYIVESIKPDVYATSHGIYSTWGPAYRFIHHAGIVTRVYSKHPYKLGGLVIRNQPGNTFDRDELERYLDNAPFSDNQRAVAKAYLDARFNHEAVDTKEYFVDTLSQKGDTSKNYQTTDYDITIGLFPNIVWDAVGRENLGVFDNVVDWVVDTVRQIGEQGLYRLIIRYHPSEATRMRGSVPSHDHIRAVLPEIEQYPNVEIIRAEEPVNSYELIRDSIDVAVVYTTSFGAEAQLLGVPVIAVASGRFSDRLVRRIRSVSEYREVLGNIEQVIEQFKDDRAEIVDGVYKYHYFVNELMYCPLGIMGKQNSLRIANIEELIDNELLDQRGAEKALRRLDGR